MTAKRKKRKALTRKQARKPAIRGRRPTKKQREKLRRERIAASMREYWKSGKTKAQRLRIEAKKLPKLPKGFQRVDPRVAIGEMLQNAATSISDKYKTDTNVRHALNSDETVSYELQGTMPPKSQTTDFLIDLTNALRAIPNTWTSVGFRFRPKTDIPEELKDKYDRYRGMQQIQAYTRRSTSRRLVALEATAEQILANVKKKRGWKPEQIFVRVHWTGAGRPSKRSGLKH